jgi:hypothetical protein
VGVRVHVNLRVLTVIVLHDLTLMILLGDRKVLVVVGMQLLGDMLIVFFSHG